MSEWLTFILDVIMKILNIKNFWIYFYVLAIIIFMIAFWLKRKYIRRQKLKEFMSKSSVISHGVQDGIREILTSQEFKMLLEKGHKIKIDGKGNIIIIGNKNEIVP